MKLNGVQVMNLKTQGKIGIREYTALIILTVSPKLADSMPVRLYQEIGNAAWMGSLIAGICAMILFYIISKIVLSYEDKNLLDVIEILCGKFFGWMIIFILWLNLSIHTIVELGINTDLVSTMYYRNTPIFIICFATLIIVMYASIKGIQPLGGAAWILLVLTQVVFLTSLILTIGYGETSFIYPLFGNGEWNAIKVGVKNTSIYFDFLYFLIFTTIVRSKKAFIRGTWIGFIIIVFEILLAILAYLILFDYKAITHLSFPYHEVIRYISLGFLTNVETLFFPFFIIITFIRFSVYLYLNLILIGRLFKIDKPRYLAPPLATIYGFICLIPMNAPLVFSQFKTQQVTFLTIFFFLLTVILWIRFKSKGEKLNV